MKQAFVVSTILVLTISLLSVGVVQAPKPTPTYSITITGLVEWSDVVVGDKKGWNFRGEEPGEPLTFGWTHSPPPDGVEFWLGDSGFQGGDTLFLGLNREQEVKGVSLDVFRIQVILDVDEKGPGCYGSTGATVNEVHLVWEWQERGNSGRSAWVLIDEGPDHPRSEEHTGGIGVCIVRLS